jgi:hypothetical protein
MSANVLALSQENRRFLSCHGQISCKPLSPSKPWVAPRSLWQSGAAIQMPAPCAAMIDWRLRALRLGNLVREDHYLFGMLRVLGVEIWKSRSRAAFCTVERT